MDSIPWLIETVVGLYFKEKQLNLLEDYQAWQEALLEKSIVRAEALWRKQKDVFRDRDQGFFDASNALVYEEHDADCAVNLATVSGARNYSELVRAGVDITDVYSSGTIRNVQRQAATQRIRRTAVAMATALQHELTLEENSARAKLAAWTNTITVRNLYDASALIDQYKTVAEGAEGLEALVSQGVYNMGFLAGDMLVKTAESKDGKEGQADRDSGIRAPVEEREVSPQRQSKDPASSGDTAANIVQSEEVAPIVTREVVSTQTALHGPSTVTGTRQDAGVGLRDVDLER